MPVWEAQVTFEGAAYSFPPATDPAGGPPYAFASYGFAALDGPMNLSGQVLAIFLVVRNSLQRTGGPLASAVYESKALFSASLFQNPDPWQGTAHPSAENDPQTGVLGHDIFANNDGGAGYTGGGTFSISKDTDSGVVLFKSPLGNYATTIAALGLGALTELRPLSVGVAFGLNTNFPPVAAHSMSVGIRNLTGLKDGEMITGAAGTAADPGIWDNWTQSLAISVNWANFVASQGSLDESASDSWAGNPLLTPAAVEDKWYRQWLGPDHPPMGRILSSLCLQTNGSLLYARVLDGTLNAIEVAYSDTAGHIWNPTLQGQVAGRMYSSPSLSENPDGTVNLFAYDNAVMATRWLKSYDFGRTFSDFGSLLPLLPWATSDHPKVMTLFNGFLLLSYNQGGHQIIGEFPGGADAVIVSTDFGPTPSGLSVYPGMWQNDEGVAYSVAAPTGIEHERQSESWGTTWEDVYSRTGNRYQVVTVKDRRNAFAFMAYQDSTGNLFVGFSADGFLTFVVPPVAVPTIPAPVVTQYVGLAVLPDGTLIVIPQVFNSFDMSWHIQPFISRDYGQSWLPA